MWQLSWRQPSSRRGPGFLATRPDSSVPAFIGERYDKILPLYVDAAQELSIEDVRLGLIFFATRANLPAEVLLISAVLRRSSFRGNLTFADHSCAQFTGGSRYHTGSRHQRLTLVHDGSAALSPS